MPFGSSVELILRAYLFCCFCHLCLFLTHLFLGYLHLLLCAHCWELQEWLWWWLEARVSTVFPFMPCLPLLPSLGFTELILMKEIIYLHFLFSAIDQNHSSFLLHAQLTGLGMFLHWAGHSAAEMLIKKIPFWLYWTRVKAASAVVTAVLSRAMSWNLLSPLCSCSPCFHSKDSNHVQGWFRSGKCTLYFGRHAEPPARFSRMEEGSWRMSYGEGFSRAEGDMEWLIPWWGCLLTIHSHDTMHCAGVLGGWKPPLLSSPACFQV